MCDLFVWGSFTCFFSEQTGLDIVTNVTEIWCPVCFVCWCSSTDHLRQLVPLTSCGGVLRMLPPPALAALQTSQLSVAFLSDVAKNILNTESVF